MKSNHTLRWNNVKESTKNFAIVGIISLVAASTFIFIVFAFRTLVDPMYRNANLIKYTKYVFYVFIWPYYFIERFAGIVNPDGSHSFHILWSPLGLLLSLAYIVIAGNIVYTIMGWIKGK